MMNMGCTAKLHKIERNLEREGYPISKAEHVAKAIVYGQGGHQHLHHLKGRR
jgi:hypothetical protein